MVVLKSLKLSKILKTKELNSKLCWQNFSISLAPFEKWIITIGNFDGIHLGHLFLLKQLKNLAKEKKLNSGVVSFSPHPQKILSQKKIYEIYGYQRKKELLANTEIHSLFIIGFDELLSKTSAEDFIQFLIQKIPIQCFLIGYDFSFGKNRQGNVDLIKKVVKKKNIEVVLVPPHLSKKQIVSSSCVRQLLQKGDFQEAATQLGLPWHLKGEVCEGKKMGVKLGFPTINLKLDFIPPLKIGVYVVKVRVRDKWYDAVANYGFAPTIKKAIYFDDPVKTDKSFFQQAILECHLFDFNENIYHHKVLVCPLKFLRNELKFTQLEFLKTQIQKDKESAENFFQKDFIFSLKEFNSIPN